MCFLRLNLHLMDFMLKNEISEKKNLCNPPKRHEKREKSEKQ